MTEFKKIFIKVLSLICDIFQLTYKLIKQIQLPNNKEKGNLFSTLFIFFTETIDRLFFFEHGIFSMSSLLRKKYVKHTIFIVGFILFQLSLFEWVEDNKSLNALQIVTQEQYSASDTLNTTTSNKLKVLSYSPQAFLNKKQVDLSSNQHNSYSYSLPVKRFLFIHSLRI